MWNLNKYGHLIDVINKRGYAAYDRFEFKLNTFTGTFYINSIRKKIEK